MDTAKSGGQEVRVGEVFMECAEKTGFPAFGFSRRGGIGAWPSQKTAFEEKVPKDFNSKDFNSEIKNCRPVIDSLVSRKPKWKSWLTNQRMPSSDTSGKMIFAGSGQVTNRSVHTGQEKRGS